MLVNSSTLYHKSNKPELQSKTLRERVEERKKGGDWRGEER
jgi:hypothetical protein